MAAPAHRVTRADRVASSVDLPPGQIEETLKSLRRADVMTRIGVCLLTAIVLWAVTGGWAPPFAYRTSYVPPRDIIARTEFSIKNVGRTREAQEQARRDAICIYSHDVQPLVELRVSLKERVFQVIRADSYESLDKSVWREFALPTKDSDPTADEAQYIEFRDAFAADADLANFDKGIQHGIADFERVGLLETLSHNPDQGSHKAILVHPIGNEKHTERVEVEDVRLAEVTGTLAERITSGLQSAGYSDAHIAVIAPLVEHWLKLRLPVTLVQNVPASRAAAEQAAEKIDPIFDYYHAGQSELAKAGFPLGDRELNLLREEHRALVAHMSWTQILRHSLADMGMFIALYVLCGSFIYFRYPFLLKDLRQFITLLASILVTVTLCRLCSMDHWRAELIPLVIFAMTLTIAYRQDLALLLSASMAVVVTNSLGQSLVEFVVYVAGMATAVLLLDSVRSRTKLIYIGLGSAVVVFLTAVGVGTVASQSFGVSSAPLITPAGDFGDWITAWFTTSLTGRGLWYGFCALLAGLIITGLLPFIERIYDVQTDISLLELGDAAHPLLQELVRRAPGTYNHSINVASIGEAAADAIGANGLLVRVGAYFHDIGKMLKPQYFIENQGQDINRHDQLLPAMSTLVIIAHVKDGADLARKHRLPQSIIDFIEQHHGTTLVEYFYRQAEKARQEDPDAGEVDETSFRYPGPKPRSKEAGVMMLSDAVESASRTLVEPTPARIESLVADIVLKRLLDGQFEECGLTLRELNTIEQSLVKSLTAVYHGRVKYPTQNTA